MNTIKGDRLFMDTAKYKSYSGKTRGQLREIRRKDLAILKAKKEKEKIPK